MSSQTFKYRVLSDIGSLDPKKAHKAGEIIELPALAKNPGGVLELISGGEAVEASAIGPITDAEREMVRQEFEQLRASAQRRVDDVEAMAEELQRENDALRQRVAELEAKVAGGSSIDQQVEAERAALEARQALEVEAKALGVDFAPQIGDAKLRERIEAAKTKQK